METLGDDSRAKSQLKHEATRLLSIYIVRCWNRGLPLQKMDRTFFCRVLYVLTRSGLSLLTYKQCAACKSSRTEALMLVSELLRKGTKGKDKILENEDMADVLAARELYLKWRNPTLPVISRAHRNAMLEHIAEEMKDNLADYYSENFEKCFASHSYFPLVQLENGLGWQD